MKDERFTAARRSRPGPAKATSVADLLEQGPEAEPAVDVPKTESAPEPKAQPAEPEPEPETEPEAQAPEPRPKPKPKSNRKQSTGLRLPEPVTRPMLDDGEEWQRVPVMVSMDFEPRRSALEQAKVPLSYWVASLLAEHGESLTELANAGRMIPAYEPTVVGSKRWTLTWHPTEVAELDALVDQFRPVMPKPSRATVVALLLTADDAN